jgi:hypothetical protein
VGHTGAGYPRGDLEETTGPADLGIYAAAILTALTL